MLFRSSARPVVLGTDAENDEDVCLEAAELETHMHIMGPPGSGKTRLLLWIYKELIKRRDATVVVVNPKGDLIRMARDAAVNAGQAERLVLFDPSDPEYVIGYNPLRPNGLGVAAHAKAAREAIRSAWGQDSFDGTPQLARFLFLALCATRELELTLLEAVQLLRAGSRIRSQMISRLRDPFVREALEYFDSLREARQEELAASTLARLEAFVMDETVRRIIAQQAHGLNLEEVICRNDILLVNLELYKPLRPDDVRLLGRLLINDILSHVFSRTGSRRPVFLLLDECQMFVTQDLCLALDQGRELGLHCVLSHQFPNQLLREDPSRLLFDSVKECARTKIVFGGMSAESADAIAKELFLCEFDPKKVKDERCTLELEPVESVRSTLAVSYSASVSASKTRARSEGAARLRGRSESQGEVDAVSSTISHVQGSVQQDSEGAVVAIRDDEEVEVGRQIAAGESETESTIDARTESYARSRSYSQQAALTRTRGYSESDDAGRSRGWTIGETRQPFYEYRKRYVVSSRTFEAFDEFLVTCMQRLQGQPKGCFVLKRPSGGPRFVRAPYVKTPSISEAASRSVRERVFGKPYYSTPSEIAAEENLRRSELEERDQQHLPALRRKSTASYTFKPPK